MGNLCQKSYEFINSFGEDSKFVVCPVCKKKVFRGTKSKKEVLLHGCIICSLKRKKINDEIKGKCTYKKCRGRYDDEFCDIDLNDKKPNPKFFFKPINFKLSNGYQNI